MSTSPANVRGSAARDPDELLFRVIHDVRALLRRSHVGAQLLERRLWERLDQESRGLLEGVLGAQRDLDQMLGRLATYADAGRSAPEEWMNLETVILGAKLSVKVALEAAGGEIASTETAGIRVPSAIQAAMVEVIHNSIRVHREGVAPRIAISAQQSPGGHVIRISDNGRGWDAAYSEKMFEPLAKLEAHSEGFGLGLAIARRIVEFQGGRMWAEPRADGGDVFIEFPRE